MTMDDRHTSRPLDNVGAPLSVYALTEFVFCPRAGLVATENEWSQEPDDARVNLGFYLPHNLGDLELHLNQALNRLWLWGSGATLTVIATLVAMWRGETSIALAGAVACIVASGPLRNHIETALQLVGQRRVLLAWQAREVVLDPNTPQPVDWRDFLQGGWGSVPCHEAYRDDARGLIGKPWCVVRRGSMTIPVWKLSQRAADAKPEIFPQHIVRMAAYCHLITTCEGRQSPCGVVLYGNTYRGTTLPFNANAQAQLWREVDAAKAVTAKVADDDRWKPPTPTATLCSGCPRGAPRVYKESKSEFRRNGEWIPVCGQTAADGNLYHSPCGDRFEWTPPHERADALGIT